MQPNYLCKSVKSVGEFNVGALLALASGKAERRQVHPLGVKSVGVPSQQ